jgi:hypothetical protein
MHKDYLWNVSSAMKQLLIILFFFISISAQGQKIHFTDTSNKWDQFFGVYNDGHMLTNFDSYRYVKDSMIDTVVYRWFDFPLKYTDHAVKGVALVREDTILNRVYIRDLAGDSDIVLLDYNLRVGDTFVSTRIMPSGIYLKYPVSSIDSALIHGVWHKVWHFPASPTGGNWPADIVEGVGCIQHPTYLMWLGGVEPVDARIYCFANNGASPLLAPKVSHLDNATSCHYFTHLETPAANLPTHTAAIYPNPAFDEIQVTSVEPIQTLTISDLNGTLWYSAVNNTRSLIVNIVALPRSVYFVKINGTTVRRFVKL